MTARDMDDLAKAMTKIIVQYNRAGRAALTQSVREICQEQCRRLVERLHAALDREERELRLAIENMRTRLGHPYPICKGQLEMIATFRNWLQQLS